MSDAWCSLVGARLVRAWTSPIRRERAKRAKSGRDWQYMTICENKLTIIESRAGKFDRKSTKCDREHNYSTLLNTCDLSAQARDIQCGLSSLI